MRGLSRPGASSTATCSGAVVDNDGSPATMPTDIASKRLHPPVAHSDTGISRPAQAPGTWSGPRQGRE